MSDADQIVLKDGDRFTGSSVKKVGAVVTLQSKNFGLIQLKWDDIATVVTDQALNVVLNGDKTVEGSLQTANDRIQVTTPGGPQSVTAGEVFALRNEAEQKTYERLLHPSVLDLWTITGSLNIAGTKGNAQTSTLTTPINFVRTSRTTRTTAYFNSIRSTAEVGGVDAQTAQAVQADGATAGTSRSGPSSTVSTTMSTTSSSHWICASCWAAAWDIRFGPRTPDGFPS